MKERAWAGAAVVAVAASGIYAWRTRAPFEDVQRWLIGPALVATVAALWGSRRRTEGDRLAWLSIAGSCAMTTTSYTLGLFSDLVNAATLDGLSGMLRAPDRILLALGLFAIVRERLAVRRRYLAIDATIVSLAAMLAMWVFIIEPALDRSTLTDGDRLLSLALPAADVLLVALAARLWLSDHARNRSFSLLLAGLVVRLVGNSWGYWNMMTEGRDGSSAVSALTAVSLALFTLAALDRSGDQRPQIARPAVSLDLPQLMMIGSCAVLPQVVLVVLMISDDASPSTVLFAGMVSVTVTVLALVRLWGLAVAVRDLAERRGQERLASLVERSSDIVVLVDADQRISYTSSALNATLGADPTTWVGRPVTDLDLIPAHGTWATVAQQLFMQQADTTVTIEATASHSDGTPRLLELTVVNLMHNVAVAGVVLTIRDVTATRTLQRQLSFRADHDALTGLANRAQFLQRLALELGHGGRPVIMFIDLDDFKIINDTMGHEAGDVLLRSIAARLTARIPGSHGLVARLGGDEFAALLPHATPTEAAALASHIIGDLSESIVLSQFHTASASCSIGIAQPAEGESASALLRNADFAMYRAKRKGKGCVEVFDAELEHEVARSEEFRRDLESALGRDQFSLVYQPIVRLRDGRLMGAEALIRWNHHVYGAVSPGDFVEIAETTGVIIPIGWWSIRQACITAASWPDRTLFVTVNLSASQLRGASMVDHVRAALAESALEPHRLVLEITESTLIDDPDGAAVELQAVRDLGVRVALDDFGTGYSSLAYVQRLPLDIVKIDREFVQNLGSDHEPLTRTIVTMAHNLGLETIGEGIEDERQVDRLAAIGCDYVQGFLIAQPLAATSMAAMLDDLVARERSERSVDIPIKVDVPIANTEADSRHTAASALLRRPDGGSTAQPTLAPRSPAPEPASALPTQSPGKRRVTGDDEALSRLLRPLVGTSPPPSTPPPPERSG